MIYIVENAVPILAAAFAAWVSGLAWYALPFGQGTCRSTIALALDALAKTWIAAILAGALILAPVSAGVWTVALGSAFIIWVGFVLPAIVASYTRRTLPRRMIVGDAAHWLVAMLLMAAVMRVVGLEAPDKPAALVSAKDDMPGLAHPLPVGNYTLEIADGVADNPGHAITVRVDADTIAMDSQCVTPRWRYHHVRGQLATQSIPDPICARALYPAEEALVSVLSQPQTLLHAPGDRIYIANAAHAVTLTSQ